MLEVLLESHGVRGPRPVGGAIASTLAHAALITALVLAGRSVAKSLRDDFSQNLSFLVPTDRGGSSAAEHLTYVAPAGGRSPNGAEEGSKQKPADQGAFVLPQIAGTPIPIDPAAALPVPTASRETAYSVVDVDSAAVRDPDSAAPAYPPVLMNKGIEGFAAMRFVVDTTGHIDLGTVELLHATNAEFVHAVREAMPRMRFRPARMGPVAVRQLAEQLFKFEIRNKVAGSAEAPTKRP